MELQLRAVPWMTNSCAGGATWPRIVGELQQSARDAINAELTFPLGWRTRMIPFPSPGWICLRSSKSDPARVAEQVAVPRPPGARDIDHEGALANSSLNEPTAGGQTNHPRGRIKGKRPLKLFR